MEKLTDLAKKVVRMLRNKNLFITSVESCTGGGFANALTNIPGASGVIEGAFVCYSNEQKIRLGVPAEVIDRFTVYSVDTASAMAKAGLAAAVRAEVGVGITGSISRIDPANPNSQPGVIYIAVTYGKNTTTGKFIFRDEGERAEVKERAIIKALKMVLEILSK